MNAQKASDTASEYARKKKEQMDNAKRMREERKTGSVLKSVGEQFVLKSPAPQN